MLEDLLLDTHLLEHRLDHHVGIGQGGVVGDAGDQREALLHRILGQAAAFDARRVGVTGALQAALQGLLIDFQQLHRHPGIGEAQRDTDTHGAATDHRGCVDRARFHVCREIVDLAGLTLGEERMNQSTTLWRVQALGEQFTLALETLGQRQLRRRLDRRDATQRREQSRHALGHLGVLGENQRLVVGAIKASGLLASASRCAAFIDHTTGIGQASVHQITLEQLVDDAVLDRLGSTDWRAADDHLQCLLDTGQTR